MNKLENLSKEISYALRHAPWEYELEMDEEGWVPVEQLLDALHRNEKWVNIGEADLKEMIEKSEKKRHELVNGKIRAFYGHSIPMKILKEEKMPPDVLYHGTARRFLESINENGLLPQSRQYVHLSQDIETAENVGRRHDDKPCILVIDAKKAWDDGVRFYLGNQKVWLADTIPSRYIRKL
ncbi:MAG: RNA 2'-phosphotransferase [Lachnospiraceae bacterium]|nr:RNA 2'-phosphotransferase [Lachnospiraceae bacterium]MBQ8260743.1 RNA 2'-phosphotransferase [Lachnospiraceae bacterium]